MKKLVQRRSAYLQIGGGFVEPEKAAPGPPVARKCWIAFSDFD
ncbi:MAG: hypothetical protein R3C29_02800 [Dehalococcoidia bacterium]